MTIIKTQSTPSFKAQFDDKTTSGWLKGHIKTSINKENVDKTIKLLDSFYKEHPEETVEILDNTDFLLFNNKKSNTSYAAQKAGFNLSETIEKLLNRQSFWVSKEADIVLNHKAFKKD